MFTATDYTKTAAYADIDHCWNGSEYYLEAHEENGAWETIDRDQAVSEDGKAYYAEYFFGKEGDDVRIPERTYAAEDIETYAQTW
ncbi:hypothetical protein [Bifidobacterium moukalabense]|uniref:Uncharacterized protein n=1 Tax=Bifidobacterium moukalabense DSM 27321 TaxID=1435051 RepID=W4N9G8_9BIFI|nr:hypothetical protein [Bifidobacterium moukalabense]ETY71328.1 hypothetical protein BMOU_0815 [Bifidobacterium moukalabense DSM 27321]ETY71674.1 hypothetical protein BMOU_0752 [Bifidobacterium moukalabense DSM 27321]